MWEYLVEVILASLSCWLVFILQDEEKLRVHLCGLRPDLMVIVGGALATAVAVWAILVGILTSDFGTWLRKKGEAAAYSRGLAVPIFAYLLGLLFLVFEGCPKTIPMLVLLVFVLLYGLINFITMIRNVNGLIRLWQTWQQSPR